MQRPQPKSNTAPLVATLLVALLVVTVGTIGFISLRDRGEHVADTGYDEPATTSNENTTTEDTFTTTTTEDTFTTTSDAPVTTTEDTPTETTPAGPQPVYELGDNPLFVGEFGAPPVSCTLRRWQTTPAAAAAFFKSALPCLDAAWQPVMQRAGLPFFTPAVQFPKGTNWSSPCGQVAGGNGVVAAFYCGENHTLYMPFAGLQTELYGARPGVYLALFAHEYGHHVQSMSGVMDAYAQARYEAGVDTAPGLELSRRLELQAQCFSGMFLASTYGRGSVNDNILEEARTSQDRGDHNAGQPRDHGTDAHTSSWWEQGAQKNLTYQCNTWKSPARDVA